MNVQMEAQLKHQEESIHEAEVFISSNQEIMKKKMQLIRILLQLLTLFKRTFIHFKYYLSQLYFTSKSKIRC